jgi:site-specific recombinase XerD
MEFVFPIFDKKIMKHIYKYLKNKKLYGIIADRDCVMIKVACNFGLRIGDTLSLEVDDFKNKNYLVIKEQKLKNKKNNKTRQMFINKKMRKIIDDYINKNNIKKYLFTARCRDTPMSRFQAWNVMKDIQRKFDLPNLGTHSCKKTFGYNFLKQFNDLEMLQVIFNHAETEETLKYVGITQEKQDYYMKNFDI